MTNGAQIRQAGRGDQGPPMRKVLVIAGNHRQFLIWRMEQHRERARRAVYVADWRMARGWGPESVEAVVLTGEWWLSDAYRDESAWLPLVRLAEAVGQGRTGWLSWIGQTQQEQVLMAAHVEEARGNRVRGPDQAQIKGEVRFRVQGEVQVEMAASSGR